MHRQRPPGTRAPRDKSISDSQAPVSRGQGSSVRLSIHSLDWCGGKSQGPWFRPPPEEHTPPPVHARCLRPAGFHPAPFDALHSQRPWVRAYQCELERYRLDEPPDHVPRPVNQYKTKTRPESRAGQGKIIRRYRLMLAQIGMERDPGFAAQCPLPAGQAREASERAKIRKKTNPAGKSLRGKLLSHHPFPFYDVEITIGRKFASFSMCLLGGGQ